MQDVRGTERAPDQHVGAPALLYKQQQINILADFCCLQASVVCLPSFKLCNIESAVSEFPLSTLCCTKGRDTSSNDHKLHLKHNIIKQDFIHGRKKVFWAQETTEELHKKMQLHLIHLLPVFSVPPYCTVPCTRTQKAPGHEICKSLVDSRVGLAPVSSRTPEFYPSWQCAKHKCTSSYHITRLVRCDKAKSNLI